MNERINECNICVLLYGKGINQGKKTYEVQEVKQVMFAQKTEF
jgi:hypothetical protein